MKRHLQNPRRRLLRVPTDASIRVGEDPHNLFPNVPSYVDGDIDITVPDRGESEGSDAQTLEYRAAFGTTSVEARDNLDTAPERDMELPFGGFNDTIKDDSDSDYLALRLVARDGDKRFLSRVTLVYKAPAMHANGSAALDWAFGYEGKLIKAEGSTDVYFVWRPDSGSDPGKSKVADGAVASRLWGSAPSIVVLDATWLARFPEAPTGVLTDARLVKDETSEKIYLLNVKGSAMASATRHWVDSVPTWHWCGFVTKDMVQSGELPAALDWGAMGDSGALSYNADTLG